MARSQHETDTQRGSRRKNREQSQSAKPRRGNGETESRGASFDEDDRDYGYQTQDRYPGAASEMGRRRPGQDSDFESGRRDQWDARRESEAGEWRPGQSHRDPSQDYGRYGGEGYAEEQSGDERYSGSRGRDYREGYEDRYDTNARGRDYRGGMGGMGQQGGMGRESIGGMSEGGGYQGGQGYQGGRGYQGGQGYQRGQGYQGGQGNQGQGGAGWGSGQALGGMGWGSETSGRHAGRGPKNWKRSDDRIEDDLNARLTSDPDVDASEIEVSVKECEVTLSGTVPDRETKRRAEDVAEMISGVRNVQNNLRVQSQSQGRQQEGSTESGRSEGKESKRNRSSGTEAGGKQHQQQQQRH